MHMTGVRRSCYHLLIVDDDVVDQRRYCDLLLRQAPTICDIQRAGNGTAGLMALRTRKPDCVLLDFSLPDMSGLEFLADAAIDGVLPCAVVLITGQGSEEIAVKAMKSGAADYLVKDHMDPSTLWHAITRAVTQTELRQRLAESQRALENREALLVSILDTVPDALIVIDKLGIIQSFSAAAERLFGVSCAEMWGINVDTLVPSLYWTDWLTGERRADGFDQIVAGRRKDGSTFPIEIVVGEVSTSGSQLLTVFVRDLTERQERERRLNELQAGLVHTSRLTELGQMVFALAHEVNQPLTAMATYLSGARQLLAAGNQLGAHQAMQRIAEQGDRARQIIQRLRNHARKRDLERRPECLLTVIEEASSLARIGLVLSPNFNIQVGGNATTALIDKIQIQQVLLNLIRNATEAMEGSAQRELSITTARAVDMVEIKVADTGPGLPDSVKARLFQPFVTTKPDGVGVGLMVCRTIVEMHGGRLWAEDGTGSGAVFCFTVPHADTLVREQSVVAPIYMA
jgi:two-component system, LuxR family, sensor kinase FixL